MMYIHFKRIFQVENVPERFKHREWAQTHHRVTGAGATENTITEGKLKKKKEKKGEIKPWQFDGDETEAIIAGLTT